MSKEEEIDKLVDEMEKFWFDRIPDTPREVKAWTGRSGAINAQVHLIKAFSPERDEAEIRKEVEAQVWEDGMYEIGGKEYIKYLGLWDKEHADGVFGVKVRDLCYIERWQDGYRFDYRIVSEEEFETLRNKNE